MSLFLHPSLPLPAPLRAAEVPSFTHYSVVTRLPDIARRTLAENHFSQPVATAIQALIDEIPAGKIRPIQDPLAPDLAAWEGWARPYLGMDYLEAPWFFVEEYFYRRILEATGYFAGGEGHLRDPYAHQKALGLQSSRDAIRRLAEHAAQAERSGSGDTPEELERLLLADLWGNQNDLSLWPVQAEGGQYAGGTAGGGLQAAQERILANDLPHLLAWFDQQGAGARVDILLDNAGYELVTDLALADHLLTHRRAGQVTLHAKSYPVFVSDAIEADVFDALDALYFNPDPRVKDLSARLRAALLDGTLAIRRHLAWNSPLPMWEIPADLAEAVGAADLLIAKGDANYRRLLGDRHWDTRLPFPRVVDYLPCAVLALRTLKSEIAVGIDPARAPATDPDWMTDGQWGLVQFAGKNRL